MSILLLLLIIPVIFGGLYALQHTGNKAVGSGIPIKVLDSTNLSEVADKVYREYMSLPAESRPFDNIKDILQSLDKTTAHLGVSQRKNHFDKNYKNRREGYVSNNLTKFVFSWNAESDYRYQYGYKLWDKCPHTDCAYAPYYDIHLEVERVRKALDAKALAMVQSENAHNVALVDELVEALRLEAGIQNTTADRIKEIG